MGRPVGRPTLYREDFPAKARELCELGATEPELATAFSVSIETIKSWGYKHREFAAALKVGREIADARVERSLYHKALGYTYDHVKVFLHEGEPVVVPYREHVPPDTTACIFWLKNRRPDLWRDKIDLQTKLEHEHRHAHLHAHVALDLSRYSAEQLRAIEDFASALSADTSRPDTQDPVADGPERMGPPGKT